MARPLRIQYPGAYYHITSRGNERKEIFKDNRDRDSFISYLKSAYLRYGAVIHVFCLMNNHYHLLLETPNGNLSQIMRHINGAYTTYFNVKHKRAGHLFQGRFKAILVEADSYAAELSRYIHLNPVRGGIARMPDTYRWSSYKYYVAVKKKPEWLSIDLIMGYFAHESLPVQHNYRNFVLAKIHGIYDSPFEKTVASTMLGSNEFIEYITEKYLSNKRIDRNLPALKELKKINNIDLIYEKIRTLSGNNIAFVKKATLYICHRYGGRSLRDIGNYFEVSESAVTTASYRFHLLLKRDRKLRHTINQLLKQLDLYDV